MTFKFTEKHRAADVTRAVWYRFFAGSRQWHNRVFSKSQSIERDGSGFTIRWPDHGELRARGVGELPRNGTVASILASGPSVRELVRLERLFDRPVACVNGAVSLAHECGRRITYYVVSDHRFILDKPELFRIGTSIADAIVLGPTAAFTAMLAAPGSLDGTNLFLREDLRWPFKRPRPSRAAMRRDPHVIAHPTSDIVFSVDPTRGTCASGTVVYDAIQLLFGIGYEELFMFGVDLTDGPRFYREERPAPTNLAKSYERMILPAFELVREYVRRSGRRLVNASPGSRLPEAIIPKADGNSVLDELAMPGTKPARSAA